MQRHAIVQLVRGAWSELWIATPRIGAAGVAALLPYLRREGARIRVLTRLTPGRLAEGKVDPSALQELRSLPGCEVRSLPDLTSSIYAAGPAGPVLVTGAALTLDDLDSPYSCGALLPEAPDVMSDLESWWGTALPVGEPEWSGLVAESSRRLEARSLGKELAKVGAFVRVSARGTRRTRRLDPREFGAAAGGWGRAVRPAEVALYKLDDVIRAREDLEGILASNGLEWNGHYLVPRHFLERDWPRIFADRERQLRERLGSPEGQAGLETQLAQARQELTSFFGEIYSRVDSHGMEAPVWVETQVTRVLSEAVTGSVLEDSGLEYRVLNIFPEDDRSVEELGLLLRDPRLRSVQLTFHF